MVLCASALFAADRLQAQDEIEGPAGDIHAVKRASDEGNDETTQIDEEPLAPQPKAKKGPKGKPAPATDAAPEKPAAKEPESTTKPFGAAYPERTVTVTNEVLSTGDDDGGPLEQRTAAQEVSGGVRVEDIVEPPSDYRFAAFGKADPFLPPMITGREALARAGEAPAAADSLEIPIISPLQRYGLAELHLIGVWQLASGERKAMIMTPTDSSGGQGIIVKMSDPVGNRGGKIQAIGDDFLTIREFLLAPDGTRQYEDQQMYMGKRALEDMTGKIRFTPGAAKTEVLVEKTQDDDASGGKGLFAKPKKGALPGALGKAGAPGAAVGAPGAAAGGAAVPAVTDFDARTSAYRDALPAGAIDAAGLGPTVPGAVAIPGNLGAPPPAAAGSAAAPAPAAGPAPAANPPSAFPAMGAPTKRNVF